MSAGEFAASFVVPSSAGAVCSYSVTTWEALSYSAAYGFVNEVLLLQITRLPSGLEVAHLLR